MKKLHNRDTTTAKNVEPNEGERTLLCSNESGMRSPSLDLEVNISLEEEQLLNQLAEILTDAFIWQSKNEPSK